MRSLRRVSCRARCSSSLLADDPVFAHAVLCPHARKSCGQCCHEGPQISRLSAGKVVGIVHNHAGFLRARLPGLSTTAPIPRGQGCHEYPQGHGFRAGKVASATRTSVCAHGVDAPRGEGHAGARPGPSAISMRQRHAFVDGKTPARRGDGRRVSGRRRHDARSWRLGAHAGVHAVAVKFHADSLQPLGRRSFLLRSTSPPGAVGRVKPGRYRGFRAGSGTVPDGARVTGEVTATRRFGVLQMSGLRSNVPLHLVATRV